MEKTVDLCVIGAAGAGLTTAVRARQLGVQRVLVLEKMFHTGGCTKMAGGIMAFDSPVQARQGKNASADSAFKDLITILNWRVDAKLVRKWITGSGENIRWLEEQGVQFAGCSAPNDRPDIARHYTHNTPVEPGSSHFTGWQIIQALLRKADELGVEILTSTPAKHLMQDPETKKITGVVAETKDGEELIVHAGAVMLATGSISYNKELILELMHTDEYRNVPIMSGFPHNTGDGVRMVEEVGGKDGKVSLMFIGPHNHFKGASEVVGAVTRRSHGMKVNRLGERFVDESLPSESEFGWMMAASIDYQPGKMTYTIIDQALLDDMIAKRRDFVYNVDFGAIAGNEIATFGDAEQVDPNDPTAWLLAFDRCVKNEEAAGRAKICGSIEEIAAYIGCDRETLEETFRVYNHSCDEKYDVEFLKDPKYLYPLRTPPYYVLNGPSGIDCAIGGVQVDNHNRVLNTEDYAIPGLYAGGVMCSGFLNGLYGFFGSEMSFTIFSGRNAAMEIAKYLKQ